MGGEFFRPVKLDGAERSKLLCRLEGGSPGAATERRRFKRWAYRASDIMAIIHHPGGGTGRFLVCPRNLSAGGISFIHGGYLHVGSSCYLLLQRRDGSPLAVSGAVIRCRHVERFHHEVGVEFLERIDPTEILPQDVLDADPDELESVEVPLLVGRALVVDESAVNRRLIMHQLAATGLSLRMVESTGTALDAIRRRRFDVVICDINLAGDGVRMIEKMRAEGFGGPILVLTAETDVAKLAAARAAGANEIVGRPCGLAHLIGLLAEWLDTPVTGQPIFSPMESTPGMAELIADFIDEVGRVCGQIEHASEQGDRTRVRELLVKLAGSGTGYGFDVLSEAARDAQTALDTAQIRADIDAPLRRLFAIARRLRVRTSVRPLHGVG